MDLSPFATREKWSGLRGDQRRRLVAGADRWFGAAVALSPVRLLVLNGQSVVDGFKRATGVDLNAEAAVDLDLPRRSGTSVAGMWYLGRTGRLGGVDLGREVQVVGWNHNLQSSFGITADAKAAIARRLGNSWEKM